MTQLPAGQQPVITTDRFHLRPLRKSDAGLINLHAGDKRVATMTSSIPHPLPPGSTEAFIARAQATDRDVAVWAIDASEDGGAEVLGLISLDRLPDDRCEIGYWIVPAYWNTGLASDAVQALVNANPMRSETMLGAVFQDNPASARVLTHCGFEYLGESDVFSIARNATVPTWTYSRKL